MSLMIKKGKKAFAPRPQGPRRPIPSPSVARPSAEPQLRNSVPVVNTQDALSIPGLDDASELAEEPQKGIVQPTPPSSKSLPRQTPLETPTPTLESTPPLSESQLQKTPQVVHIESTPPVIELQSEQPSFGSEEQTVQPNAADEVLRTPPPSKNLDTPVSIVSSVGSDRVVRAEGNVSGTPGFEDEQVPTVALLQEESDADVTVVESEGPPRISSTSNSDLQILRSAPPKRKRTEDAPLEIEHPSKRHQLNTPDASPSVEPESDIQQTGTAITPPDSRAPENQVSRQKKKPRSKGNGRAGKRREIENAEDGQIRKRGTRAATPDSAEDAIIDPATIKMSELCKDLRIGKKFSKHDEIKQRIAESRAKARRIRLNPELAPPAQATGEEGESGSVTPEEESAEGPQGLIASGPQMRVVDGQIVLDDNSLQIDRHALAQAERGVVEEVVEDEFSKIITSGTFMKRERAQLWDAAATDTFYSGLSMFGTDFEMIAKMFPHRNRRQIKLKFNKEEKDNPSKINKVLIGSREPIDMALYGKMTGLKFQSVADIEAERKVLDDEQAAEQERYAAEQAEATRKKKEAIRATSNRISGHLQGILEAADSDAENEAASGREASAAPKSKKKAAAKKKTKKNRHLGSGDNGGEVEILGTIGD